MSAAILHFRDGRKVPFEIEDPVVSSLTYPENDGFVHFTSNDTIDDEGRDVFIEDEPAK